MRRSIYLAHSALFQASALDAIAAARSAPGISSGDDLALRFFRLALVSERMQLSVGPLENEYDDAEADATVAVPWKPEPVAFRDVPSLIAQEPDAGRRRILFDAQSAVRAARLNPILLRKEEASRRAAREAGYPDYVALSEELRGTRMQPLLAQGIAYLQTTDAMFHAQLDRVAREELGVPREKLHAADLQRLWKGPQLSRYFDRALQMKALELFLSGMGLDLRTAAGTAVVIDDAPRPRKVPRAFVEAVDAPADIRLSLKPSGGLDDYESLFHEAGHAVHFASATIEPVELRYLGPAAPTEAFGELFRQAFCDPRWLVRYGEFLRARHRPVPSPVERGRIARHVALREMFHLRRYAFAGIAYELRLHGRPPEEIAPALLLVPPVPAGDLRALYRALFSRAYGFDLDEQASQSYLSEMDDTFYAAEYARSFVLAGMMRDALRRRFGEDFYGDSRIGRFLREELFSQGTSLSAEQVAERLGLPPRLDFAGAARRAARLISDADALDP